MSLKSLKYLSLIVGIQSLTLVAFATDTSCRYRNLMEDNWLKLRNQVRSSKKYIDMPAYDQSVTGTCYAFTATQMVDHWRQSRGFMPDERLELASPIHMALVFRIASGYERSTLNSGIAKDAIMALKKYGLCSKEAVNRDLKEFLGKKFQESYFKYIGQGMGVQIGADVVFAALTEGVVNPEGIEYSGQFKSWKGEPLTFDRFMDSAQTMRKNLFYNYDRESFKKIYSAFEPYFEKGDYLSFLNDVLKSCNQKENQIPFLDQMPTVRSFYPESFSMAMESKLVQTQEEYHSMRKEQFRNKIRSMLNLQNAPAIGATYCADVLNDPSFIAPISYHGDLESKRSCGTHLSLIMGKRENEGKCQYLVKNTWNSPDLCNIHGGCIYRDVLDPNTKDPYKEEVGMWMDEEEILNNVAVINYIYPEEKSELEIQSKFNRLEENFLISKEALFDGLLKIRARE